MRKNKRLKVFHSGGYNYSVIASGLNTEEYGHITVYGIEISGGGCKNYAEDISCVKDEVIGLAGLMAEERLCPEHLYDVVDDFLSDKAMYTGSFKGVHKSVQTREEKIRKIS